MESLVFIYNFSVLTSVVFFIAFMLPWPDKVSKKPLVLGSIVVMLVLEYTFIGYVDYLWIMGK
jgi:hypothetical protein